MDMWVERLREWLARQLRVGTRSDLFALTNRRSQPVADGLRTIADSGETVAGLSLPQAGRSSVEGSAVDRFSSLRVGGSPAHFDFAMLRVLKWLWINNPDLSQYVANIVNLGNTGHDVIVDAESSQVAEQALARINTAAMRLYSNSAGVDGLLNAYFAQIAWSGALSSEDVVNLAARRVERVALVPVEQIRFELLNGEYVPHQLTDGFYPRSDITRSQGNLIKLNPETYRYFALTTVENSPYAKPPASSAVNAITGLQADMLENIKWISRKLGILGLVSVMVTPPPKKPNEAEGEYQSRAQRYLGAVRDALDQNFNKGLLVTYRDQKIEHANVASDARGAYEIWRLNEEQIMSGLAMQPAFFGRTDSTTETYADVVYNLLLAQVANIQRLVKRRQEATYRLDLLLGGIEVKGVSLRFNRARSRNLMQESQADERRVKTAIEKVKAGITSPDQAAQELGYESAYDPELLTGSRELARALSRTKDRSGLSVRFRFDQLTQQYKSRC